MIIQNGNVSKGILTWWMIEECILSKNKINPGSEDSGFCLFYFDIISIPDVGVFQLSTYDVDILAGAVRAGNVFGEPLADVVEVASEPGDVGTNHFKRLGHGAFGAGHLMRFKERFNVF